MTLSLPPYSLSKSQVIPLRELFDPPHAVIQNELDGNVAKRRRDVAGKPRGLFRLAETVPETWQGKGNEGEVLKVRFLIPRTSQIILGDLDCDARLIVRARSEYETFVQPRPKMENRLIRPPSRNQWSNQMSHDPITTGGDHPRPR